MALKGVNEDELDELIAWTGQEGFDLMFIEVMPMGDIGGEIGSTSICRCRWCAPGCKRWTLDEIDYRTGGPARYVASARDRPAARLHHAVDP